LRLTEQMALSTDKFNKIEGQKEVKKYGLPMSDTHFIFSYKKQEKEINDFLSNKKFVSIRTDSKINPDFCPHDLKCPVSKAKEFIKDLNSKKYAVILSEFIPWIGDKVSGNILVLKNFYVIELMGEGPLVWLTREGRVDEWAVFQKNDLSEVRHSGKRIVPKKEIQKILDLIKNIPLYKIIEFTLRPEAVYFWQIRNDKSSSQVEKNLLTIAETL
jgi:hypothetical protein